MTERKQFTPYGYNPYQHQPEQGGPSPAAQQERATLQRRNRGLVGKIFGEEIANKMSTPLFATVSLLAVGVAFAAVIAISYPSGSETSENVPVVTAAAMNYKIRTVEDGESGIPHKESTVFNVMSSAESASNPFNTDRPIENLLEPTPPVEEAVDVMEALAEDAQTAVQDVEPAAGDAGSSVESLLVLPEAIEEQPTESVLQQVEPEEVATIQQTIEKVPPQDLVRAVDDAPKQPEKLHAAGSSPDTIAFVRSVLDQKDTKGSGVSEKVAAAQAANLNAIAPASGGDAVQKTPSVTPGNYYVQLGSVTSRTGADSEWTKMGKTLPLAGLEHRVQEANLGERGTYYRIQAGPMSKDSADGLCDSIKAQKPGGCLVVK